jgi:rhodanese-related sulfurtransferase
VTTQELPKVDALAASQWLEGGEAVLVDVRETHEFEYENIPGSLLLPLSFLEPERFPAITEKKVVLLCVVGKRSAAAQKQLVKHGLANIFNLSGGLDAWKKAELETQGGKFESVGYSI